MNKHNLREEFPEHEERIHELKTIDQHFKKLFDDYHDINNQIHAIETEAFHTTDEVLNQLISNTNSKGIPYQLLKDESQKRYTCYSEKKWGRI